MMGIFAVPFTKLKVKNGGASTVQEFSHWVDSYGEDFYHDINMVQRGSIFIFGWISSPGDWTLVGDGIVKDNHETGSEDWCDCEKKDISGFSLIF